MGLGKVSLVYPSLSKADAATRPFKQLRSMRISVNWVISGPF